MKIRVGFGYDVHQLVAGRDLWLGGIKIQHTHGLLGHSDADVLIHAICDALLGAANMSDIGYHFPDTGKEFEGIDNLEGAVIQPDKWESSKEAVAKVDEKFGHITLGEAKGIATITAYYGEGKNAAKLKFKIKVK